MIRLRDIAVGLASIVIAASSACGQPQQVKPSLAAPSVSSSATSTLETRIEGLTFEMVTVGKISPEEYIAFLSENMPELIVAKRAGWINAIYYNPSPQQIRQIAEDYSKEINQNNTPSKEEADVLNKLILDTANSNQLMSAVYEFTTQGNGYLAKLIIWPGAFSSGGVKTEKDMRNMVLHEIEHAKRYHSGNNIGDLLRSKKVSPGFAYYMEELIVTAKEIDNVFASPEGFSFEYKTHVANNFLRYQDNLCPSTEEENVLAKSTRESIGFDAWEETPRVVVVRDFKRGLGMRVPYLQDYPLRCLLPRLQ